MVIIKCGNKKFIIDSFSRRFTRHTFTSTLCLSMYLCFDTSFCGLKINSNNSCLICVISYLLLESSNIHSVLTCFLALRFICLSNINPTFIVMALKCFSEKPELFVLIIDPNLKIQAVDFPTIFMPIFEVKCVMENHVSNLGW
jgi:hypothetical protein